MATRWDEDNVKPQCFQCNITDQGRQWRFGRYLDSIEPELAAKVMARSEARTKNSANVLIAAIEHYRELLQELEEQKNLNWKRTPRPPR